MIIIVCMIRINLLQIERLTKYLVQELVQH